MGISRGDFTKYPRTPHLFGSKGTDDDTHLGEAESKEFIADESMFSRIAELLGRTWNGQAWLFRSQQPYSKNF